MADKGTTLLELLVVLTIVGLVTAAGADFLLRALPRSERQLAVVELASELRAARQLAMRQGQPAWVRIDDGGLQVESREGVVWRHYRYASHGISQLSLSRGSAIIFYPSGRVASPVTITVVTRRGEAGRITVTLTGKVNWS